MVVINCANVGFDSNHQRGGGVGGQQRFDWEAVRQAFRFYDDLHVTAQGVCKKRTADLTPVPADLKSRVVICPPVDDEGDIDDLYTIRVAMCYGCQFVDNDNYRDWKRDIDKGSQEVRAWLQGDGAKLKVTFIFDANGRFVPSVYPPAVASRPALGNVGKAKTR
eukprot:UN3723